MCPRCHNAAVVSAKSRMWFELWVACQITALMINGIYLMSHSGFLYRSSLCPVRIYGYVPFVNGKYHINKDMSPQFLAPVSILSNPSSSNPSLCMVMESAKGSSLTGWTSLYRYLHVSVISFRYSLVRDNSKADSPFSMASVEFPNDLKPGSSS